MDASFRLGQGKQTDENKHEGERARRRRTWGLSVRAAVDHPAMWSDQGHC